MERQLEHASFWGPNTMVWRFLNTDYHIFPDLQPFDGSHNGPCVIEESDSTPNEALLLHKVTGQLLGETGHPVHSCHNATQSGGNYYQR